MHRRNGNYARVDQIFVLQIPVNIITTVVKDVHAIQVAKQSGEQTRIHEIGRY